MEFTEKDRQFIRKIATKLETIDIRLKNLEKKTGSSGTPSPISGKQPVSVPRGARGNPGSTIDIVFKDRRANEPRQKILVESLYQTLREVCEQNNIYTLDIKISNTK